MKARTRRYDTYAGMVGLAALLVAPMTSACGPRYVIASPQDAVQTLPPGAPVTRHVVVISVDGLRPDAIEVFGAPTLRTLIAGGSYTLEAATILPSKTLPSHTSMLTGVPPDRHGVVRNDAWSTKSAAVEYPTIFTVARSHGYRTAAFFSKSKFHSLQRPGTLDYSKAPGGWFGRWSSERVVKDVEAYLDRARPNLLFVHLSDPDAAGHRHGWMTADYGRAVLAADGAIAKILTAAGRAYGHNDYSVIVTADHGGHDRDHGSDDLRDVTIPWIAWGRGVAAGPLTRSVRTMDTAATVVWLLGLAGPADWVGVPVAEAFSILTVGAGNTVSH